MNKHEITMNWKGDMSFEGIVDGHKIALDADTSAGGKNSGARPKPLMLLALSGCSGLDVIYILKKMRIEVEDFNVSVSAELTEDHPIVYNSMHLVYEFKGKNLNYDKLKSVIEMSQEKYCGVYAMYKQFVKITYDIKISD